VPVLDDAQRSSVKLLYVAGDAAGIAGPEAATRTGRTAALAALGDLGLLEPAAGEARVRAEHRAISFEGVPDVTALVRAIPPDCVVCPCETLTRRDVEAAVAAGARDVNQIKQFTRCGMGPCQGRICGEAVAELVALRVGGRAAAGLFTARIPLRPVPMATLLGAFDYADIPVPAPAPI
jgi:bacterioferritin-associated ferredoxin